MNTNTEQVICTNNRHKFLPLGFHVLHEGETKVEVIAAIVCTRCGTFRTKILYYDRQQKESVK
jgi:hypothetical protein